ncbi:hypothetical protein IFM89_032041 [Coptis chinensis]|uniref:Uncharacterized protein n=1 Tax=Coptis chinensis TaxID=261450 RepID=A0A835H3Z8_9MAGN|nr:hypothetical protein IFM89_032041 [Coptis chinensis]
MAMDAKKAMVLRFWHQIKTGPGMLVYTFPSCSQDIVLWTRGRRKCYPFPNLFCANWYSRSPWTSSLGCLFGVDLVDLRDVKIVKKLGGTVDDTELVKGLVFDKKAKILVVKDVERDAIEFITKTLNCLPIANIEHFREEKMGRGLIVWKRFLLVMGKIVKITGIKDMGRTTAIACLAWDGKLLCRGHLRRLLKLFHILLLENAGLNPIAIADRARIDMQSRPLVSTAITLATESREDDPKIDDIITRRWALWAALGFILSEAIVTNASMLLIAF